MKTLHNNSFKFWFFVLAVTVFTFSLLRLPGAQAETPEERFDLYSRENVGLTKAITQYHKNMNDIVNDYLERLITGGDDVIVAPPAEDTCEENNVSTYCLSLKLVDEYEAFRQALNKTHRPSCTDPNITEEGEEVDFQLNSSERLLQKCADLQQLIDDQINIALKVMEVTLGVYNEVQVFYPMHVQYQGLIEDLEVYRDSLATLRRQIEVYPKIFVDAITTECT